MGDFQVLACLPPSGSVPVRDVAHLSLVREAQLAQVIRMTATAGFLREPQPGTVAHTPLSARFVSHPPFRDAAMFLAECAVPAALQMATATRRRNNMKCGHDSSNGHGHSLGLGLGPSAYGLAFDTLQPFAAACDGKPKLQRQWTAYLQHAAHDADESIADVLTRLDWGALGPACVVEVCTVTVSLYPYLSPGLLLMRV